MFVTFFQDIDGADEARLMEQDSWAVEQEPDDRHVNDDRDVDGLAKTRFGAFVVQRIEKMDQLMLFEFAITACAHLDGLGRWRGVGRRLEGGGMGYRV